MNACPEFSATGQGARSGTAQEAATIEERRSWPRPAGVGAGFPSGDLEVDLVFGAELHAERKCCRKLALSRKQPTTTACPRSGARPTCRSQVGWAPLNGDKLFSPTICSTAQGTTYESDLIAPDAGPSLDRQRLPDHRRRGLSFNVAAGVIPSIVERSSACGTSCPRETPVSTTGQSMSPVWACSARPSKDGGGPYLSRGETFGSRLCDGDTPHEKARLRRCLHAGPN